jgi:uncharacterized protein YkwD
MKNFVTVFLILALTGCGSMSLPSILGDDTRSTVKSILDPINEARAKGQMCGAQHYEAAQPVVWNKTLGEVALEHSLDMAENGFLSHKGSDGLDTGERLARAGYQWTTFGENIGQGYKTPQDAVHAWLRSKRHCKNIMNPAFKEAGVAYAKSKSLRYYWTIILGAASE